MVRARVQLEIVGYSFGQIVMAVGGGSQVWQRVRVWKNMDRAVFQSLFMGCDVCTGHVPSESKGVRETATRTWARCRVQSTRGGIATVMAEG